MVDQTKSKDQLMEEIKQLRQRVAELEGSKSETPSLEQDISQTIIDTSPAFFVIIDFEGKTKMVSKSMLAALGYAEEEVQGKDYLSTFVPERERASLSKLFEKELLRGKSTVNQNHVLTKDGRELLCEWQGRPLLDPKGKVELFCGVGLDITERQRSQEVLKQSEQRYRLLIENIPSVAWITARDGQTVFISDNVEKVYGFTSEEILSAGGELWFDRIHPEDRVKVQKAFERLFSKQEEYKIEYRIQRKDGKWIWLLDSANMVEDVGGRSLAYGVFSDVTERKQAEEAYRVLVESSLQALVIIQDQRIVFANPAAEVATGYTSKELMSMEYPFQTLIYPEDLPERLERGAQFARGKTVPPQTVYRIIERSGQLHWVEAYTVRIEWGGKPAIHATFVDITDRKKAEDELKRISREEKKRRQELEKLREISTNMRQAERSNELLQVFTREVQRLCQDADVASSILFKARQEPVTFLAPEADIELSQEQSDAIRSALLDAKTGALTASIPGFETVFILQLQSADAVHGAVLVASREREAFTADQKNLLNAAADMAGTALNRIDIWETLEDRVQQRTRNLIVLYNLITIISENWRLQDLLELSLMLTLETVKADRGIIYLKDEKDVSILKPVIQRGFTEGFQIEVASLPDDALARKVFKKQKPLSLDNLDKNPSFAKFKGLTSYAGIPILARGDARGVFSLFADDKDAFGAEEMALLVSIADHLGIGINNSILFEQSRESAALEERNRLARDLHDSVSQLLYSLTLMTGTTKRMLERGSDLEAVKNSVERLGDTAQRALKEMRLLLFELRPAVLDSEGLINALRQRIKAVEEEVGINVELQAEGLPELPNYVEDALYHIAMEALNNIVKHADSKVATIQFTSYDDKLVMEISDQGKGFDTDLLQRGLGLSSMRERGQMLGSEVSIVSKPGEGTRVTVEVQFPSDSLVSS